MFNNTIQNSKTVSATSNGMKIFVKVKTGAKKESLARVDDTHFVISTTKRPIKGQANEAIAKTLAEYFGIAPRRVRMVSGIRGRSKVFEVK